MIVDATFCHDIEKVLDELTENLSLIHISEPTRRVVISYAVFCLKKKNRKRKIRGQLRERFNTKKFFHSINIFLLYEITWQNWQNWSLTINRNAEAKGKFQDLQKTGRCFTVSKIKLYSKYIDHEFSVSSSRTFSISWQNVASTINN